MIRKLFIAVRKKLRTRRVPHGTSTAYFYCDTGEQVDIQHIQSNRPFVQKRGGERAVTISHWGDN